MDTTNSLGELKNEQSTAVPQPINLKQDTKKRKTWVWVPVVEETKNEEEEIEINNSGRAKRSSMKKAAENISASLARKPPPPPPTSKKKRPKAEIIPNDVDEKLFEEEMSKTSDSIEEKIKEPDEILQTDQPESDMDAAINKYSRESSIVVVVDEVEEEIAGVPLCSTSPNIDNYPGSISSNQTEPSDLPFSDMAIMDAATKEEDKIKEETENNLSEEPKPIAKEQSEETEAEVMEIWENEKIAMEKPDEKIDEPKSNEIVRNEQEKEKLSTKQRVGIPVEAWPPFPQYKKIEENIMRCKDAESKEFKSFQCECNPSSKEKKRGFACADECLNRLLLMECGPECRSGKYCTNMRFQKREYADLEIFFTGPKGWGLRTKKDIQIGQFLIEYVGEVINSVEMEKRIRRYGRDPNHKHHYLMALRSGTVIDATQNGNESRFINHSCDPNAVTQKWTVGRELRIGFFAIKPIQAGQEITFNYQFERYGKRAQKCFCETASCTGFIGSTKEMGSDAEDMDSDSTGASEYSSDDNDQDDSLDQKSGGTKFIPFFSTERTEYLARKHGTSRKIGQMAGQIGGDERRGSLLPHRRYRRRKGLAAEGHHHRRVHLESISNPILREHAEVNEILLRGPLRNREQVLEFNRLMVRVDQQESRRRMVDFLLRIDDPNILRIFVANQGFALIRIWFVLPQFERRALQLQAQIARLLLRLPVTNKNQIDEVSIMSTLKQMITFELPDKYVVKDVVNKLVDSIALEFDDSGSSPQHTNRKSDPHTIVREFDTLKDLASKLYEKWENLVDWEFRIPKKMVKSKAEMKEHRSRSRHERERFRNRRNRVNNVDDISPIRTSRTERAGSFERGFDHRSYDDRTFDGPRGRYQRFQRHYRKFLPPHIRRKFHRNFPPPNHGSPFNDARSFSEKEEKTPAQANLKENAKQKKEEEDNSETYFDPNEPPPTFFNLPLTTQTKTASPTMMATNPLVTAQQQQVSSAAAAAAAYFPSPYSPYYPPYYYPGAAAYIHPSMFYHQDPFAAMAMAAAAAAGGGYMAPPPPPPDKPKQMAEGITSNELDQANRNIKSELSDVLSTADKNEEGDEPGEQIVTKKEHSDNKDQNEKPRERVKNKSAKDIQAEMLQRRLQSLRASLGQKASPSHWPPEKAKDSSSNKSRSHSRDRNKESKSEERRDRSGIKDRRENREREERKEKNRNDEGSRRRTSREEAPSSLRDGAGRSSHQSDRDKQRDNRGRKYPYRYSISPERDVGTSHGRRNSLTGRKNDKRDTNERGGREGVNEGRHPPISKQSTPAGRIKEQLVKKAIEEQNKKREEVLISPEEQKHRHQKQEEKKAAINIFTAQLKSLVQPQAGAAGNSMDFEISSIRQRTLSGSSISSTSSGSSSDSDASSTTTSSELTGNGNKKEEDLAKIGLESNATAIASQKSVETDNDKIKACSIQSVLSAPKLQPFKVTRINPTNLPSTNVNNAAKITKPGGHFLPPPATVSSDEDEGDDEMMQPPEISVDILQDANKLDAYIHQLKEFVYFMETMRREMHGPLPFPGQLLLNQMRAMKIPIPMKRSRQQIDENEQIIQDETVNMPKRARIEVAAAEMEPHKSNENLSSSHSNTPPEDPSVSTVKNNEQNVHLHVVPPSATTLPLPAPYPAKMVAAKAIVSDPRLSASRKSMLESGAESESKAISIGHSSKTTISAKCEIVQIKEEIQMEIDNNQQPSKISTIQSTEENNKLPMMMASQFSTGLQEEANPISSEEPTTSTALPLSNADVPLMSKSGLWLMHRDTDGTPYYYHRETRETRWELPEGEEIMDPDNAAASMIETDSDERQKVRAEFKRQVSALTGKCIESYRKRFFRSSNDYINFIRKITHKVLENQENNKELLFTDQVQKNTRRLVDDYIRHFKNREMAESQKLAGATGTAIADNPK